MKFIFLFLFLSGCVVTEMTLQLGQKSPNAEEIKKTENFLDSSLAFREAWAYAVIPIVLPFSLVVDFIVDLYDFPRWIF